MRQAWGDSILKTKQWDIYVAMRARIALRKVDMPLQVEQVEEEIKNIRSNNGRPITVEDIMAALECGEEVFNHFEISLSLPSTSHYIPSGSRYYQDAMCVI